MAAVDNLSLVEYYLTDAWNEYGDPRLKDYPMMSTFKIPLAILGVYLFFVLYLGPRLMANRKPFSLKWIIIPYNLIMSVVNLYFFIQLLRASEMGRELLNVDFRPTDDTSPLTLYVVSVAYAYLVSKYIDKLDTIFFVLRKKQSQVTGLHVYHHSMVPLMGWVYFRTNAFHVGASAFAILNTPIHTVCFNLFFIYLK